MSLDTAKHKTVLLQILKDIYSDMEIAPYLGFKGGTAAYIFYDLDRFSVDLDFDLLDDSKEKIVFSRLEEIVKNYGDLKDARTKRFNLFFLLSYEDRLQKIKIEVNRRSFGSRYELKTYLGISMLVMIREDMFAHKLMAMCERIGKANRDIFDVHFFLKNNCPINEKIIEERSGLKFDDFLRQAIAALEKTTNRNILHGIGELLNKKQKDWVKSKLIADTVFLLKLKLENKK